MAEKKIVVKIDDGLHYKARMESVRRGVPLSVVVRDAIAAFVAEGPGARRRKSRGGEADKTK